MSAANRQCCVCPTPEIINIPGISTAGIDAFTFTTANFVVPAVGAQVAVQLQNSEWMVPGQAVIIEGPANFLVVSESGTSAILQFLGYSGDVAPGTNLLDGSKVSPSGLAGPASGGFFGANNDPNGTVVGSPPNYYFSSPALGGNGSFWLKDTGTSTNTGWVQVITGPA